MRNNTRTILDAIEQGFYQFEPTECSDDEFDETDALPGTDEKVDILAKRIELGLPLWHPSDRLSYDEEA
jgi:hypothetical protein